MVMMKRRAGPSAAAVVLLEFLSALSGCAGLNNVRELDVSQHYRPTSEKAVLLYGGELQSPWPGGSMARPATLNFEEYDAVAGRNKGNCWRFNHTESLLDTTKIGAPKFSAFIVDPGYFVLNRFSAPDRIVTDAAAFYAAPGTVSYVGTYVYKGEKDGFELRRDLGEGQAAARQFSGLAGPVVMAPTIPVRENNAFVCTP
ncbi:hypothetical protein [Pleomorphomonas oryzae]|uniref:hypothetical protein n=1 Tax=Pleomorphomonas oryzae TaxID=261934 RepID=UPI00047D21D7|nr:hypothetical protein [Pleomorphomonas oryzae]